MIPVLVVLEKNTKNVVSPNMVKTLFLKGIGLK
jgi:hypothetical protein